MPQLVSVVVPTTGRAHLLRNAVQSILHQELPADWTLEVVVSISGGASTPDLDLGARGSRVVRFVKAERSGPAAARNTAIRVSKGTMLAFVDDDCAPEPGWLAALLGALVQADLAQGRTIPASTVPRLWHSISVEPPSWLWETCNLAVRREAIERGGVFNEDWSPVSGGLSHFGEDAEWGWRLVQAGARSVAVPGAVVRHAVLPRGLGDYLRYWAGVRHYPYLIRSTPACRRHFYRGYFFNRRHVALAAAGGLVVGSVVLSQIGKRRGARGLAGLAALAYVSRARGPLTRVARRGFMPPRGPASRDDLTRILADGSLLMLTEAVQFGALLYGSIRWRRLLL